MMFLCFLVTFIFASERSIVIKTPANTSHKQLPVFMIFGGFEDGARVLELIRPEVPVILATVDYPYDGDRRFHFPESLIDGWKLRQSIPDMQKSISDLVAHLKTRKDVDQNRIAIVGASFGAPYAIHAASLNSDIRALVIVHGFADIQKTIHHRLAQIWSNKLGKFSSPVGWIASQIITLFLNPPRPEEDVKRLRPTQIGLMIEATDDSLIPLSSRELLWQSLQKSDARIKRIPMPGDHLQPGADALIQKIMNVSVSALKSFDWFN